MHAIRLERTPSSNDLLYKIHSGKRFQKPLFSVLKNAMKARWRIKIPVLKIIRIRVDGGWAARRLLQIYDLAVSQFT